LPQEREQGFTFHDCYVSIKQELLMRRIKWSTTGAVFTRRPSFVMPYLSARTDEVETALSLRQWGGPFDALAYVFGRDAMFWYRAWLAFGRPSLLGTPVTDPHKVPSALVADEKLTRVAKQQVYVPTTVGGGCFLGVSVVEAADTGTLERGYGDLPRKPRLSRLTTRRARSAPTAGKRPGRRGGGSFPRSKWGCAFSTRS
jgi:hypothetical protein